MNVVLVPIDGSPAAYRALSLALKELGGAADSTLHLLNVQPPADAGADASPHARGAAMLAQAQDMALGAHRRVVPHVRTGRAEDEILACAQELGCDFVFMGTRGLGAAAAATLGSVALEVARRSRIPVTLVR
ncbi:universal stress protein [Ramlibacter sp. USB13]|uniref:Universal stress protein n=1 Tax=Ramlibacter cellulosilyticus TaxID=2764187 RepID=A0A923SAV6_9BURK|nr:universal stress protein [Ramlibacter cellulosilyticus]